jgi:type VI secretion system secreted protein Hcp
MFIKIEGIKGESNDVKHKDEIDVLAWAWGMSQSAAAMHSGGTAGKISFKNLTITKRIDSASSALMLACSSGKHIKEAMLTLQKPGGRTADFVRLTLNDLIVSSLDNASSGSDEVITEQVSLDFSKVQFEYFRQKPDGSLEPVSPFKWDLRSNKIG